WTKWLDTVPHFEIPRNAAYDAIVVPTIDSIQLTHVMGKLVTAGNHVLIFGNTGTGKSIHTAQWLQKEAPETYQSVFVNFSAQTHVNQLQDLIDSKTEKRRRGVFGPPAGKQLVIFVDDLNMPQKEYYGAQPPIELLRQWHDHGGWYDRKELTFQAIIDTTYITAMGPPGGGRTFITERLKRHHNMICAIDMQRSSVETIFKTIVEYFLAGFEEPIRALKDPLVSAAYDIFEMVHRELLPTPAKSHYTFNLRDIWKVFQGICSLSPKKNTRVYGDRLINDEDRAWFNSQCKQRIPLFKGPTEEEVYDKPSLVFGDFLSTGDEKYYVEVEDLSKIQATMETYLDDYNNSNTHQMPLVMFFNACEHVARIC
ncbi:Dynein heavy chain 1, axonemal, partial [Perkinsus olseni]